MDLCKKLNAVVIGKTIGFVIRYDNIWCISFNIDVLFLVGASSDDFTYSNYLVVLIPIFSALRWLSSTLMRIKTKTLRITYSANALFLLHLFTSSNNQTLFSAEILYKTLCFDNDFSYLLNSNVISSL